VDTEVLSHTMLSVLYERWKDHLYDLDQLRNAIQYRAWGQKDPLVEYKREAYEMFEDLMHDIQSTFTERFFKTQVTAEPPRPEPQARRAAPLPPAEPVGADDMFTTPPRRIAAPPSISPGLSTSNGPVGRATAAVPEVGRNDPCPCGSGRKYKKCHGAGR
jgi:preprotein translocase subunit SecA